jgi:hypothetical protein
VSTAELFDRLKIASPADEPASEEPESFEERFRPAIHPAPSISPPDAAHPADEESIDDYMARLLNRLRAGSSSQGPLGSAIVSRQEQGQAAPAIVPLEAGASAPGAKTRSQNRTAPPELNADLRAMREVANMSARSAIDLHSRRKLRDDSSVRLLVGGLCLLIACGLLGWNIASRGIHQLILYPVATFCMAVGVFMTMQYVRLARGAKVEKSPPKQGPTTPAESDLDGRE